jgi:hypothetical protein
LRSGRAVVGVSFMNETSHAVRNRDGFIRSWETRKMNRLPKLRNTPCAGYRPKPQRIHSPCSGNSVARLRR